MSKKLWLPGDGNTIHEAPDLHPVRIEPLTYSKLGEPDTLYCSRCGVEAEGTTHVGCPEATIVYRA